MIATVRAGDLYHPTLGGGGSNPLGGVCKMGTSFVYTTVGVVDEDVPDAGVDQLVWTTPSEPFVLEHAFIQLTAECTASQNPGTPALSLSINGIEVVGGTMTAWTGKTYDITGSNVIMWGLKSDVFPGGLLGTQSDDGTGDRGAMSGDGCLAVLTDGGSNGYWNKPVNLHIAHGTGTIQLHIPWRVILIGRLL